MPRRHSAAGRDLADAGIAADLLHTSVQRRAIYTAELALRECERSWIPVRRSWRLNERHYGALQGKDKAETARQFSPEQVKIWRRSYDVPPEPMDLDDPNSGIDARYDALPRDVLPARRVSEGRARTHAPVVGGRDRPRPPNAARPCSWPRTATRSAALVKHLEGLSPEQVVELNLPTGEPLVYELDEKLQPGPAGVSGLRGRFLDPERAAKAAEAVAKQAG